ncbi:hypothetical protein A4A49_40464 [Nicotiana attenuata]|uniref:SWIM-type domain-containing protein n=1 Tax=Nicotiana attenuata TaxID=49451 RepID=A0A314KZS0_NICAT|nr:hypothetical protein A4A49_40464 [Nicotiana attenuata]
MDEYIGVVFHHGGYFIDEKYVGEGEVIGHVVDKDHFSLPELVSYIKETPEMRYNSVAGLFVLCPKTQKFFPIENDYQLLNLIKDLKDGDRFDVYVSHAIDNLEVVEEDVVVGYLPSSQVGDSDQATEIRGGPGVSVDVGEGAGVNVDEGIGVNCNEGIGVTADEGNGVNTDEGIGVNCEEGIGVNADEDIEVNTAEGSDVNAEQPRSTILEEDINVEESAAAEHDNQFKETNLEDEDADFGEDDLEDIPEEDDSEIDDELRSVRDAAREVKRNKLKSKVNDAGSQSNRKQRKKPVFTEEVILGEAGIDKGHKSVITMLEEIRHKMMSRQVDMIKFVETWASDISPMARLVLEENKEIGRKLKVQWNADTGFEVNEGMYRHTVDIQKRECSCRLWQLRGIPCQHAICAFYKIGKEAEDYVEHWYRKDTFLAAYQYYIQPIPSIQMWAESTNPPIEPPEVKPIPGWSQQVSMQFKAISATAISLAASVGKKRTRNSGFGLYTDTQTGTSILNHGRPSERVISTDANLMNAAQTNVDLGFRPNSLKWKGKRAVTGNQLQKQTDAAVSNKKMKVGTSTSSTPIDSCQSQI